LTLAVLRPVVATANVSTVWSSQPDPTTAKRGPQPASAVSRS
jgi:hypothetical protein